MNLADLVLKKYWPDLAAKERRDKGLGEFGYRNDRVGGVIYKQDGKEACLNDMWVNAV